ncbi:MAG: ChrR family anti-sigma-E factor [Pseudomonadota bacterium]
MVTFHPTFEMLSAYAAGSLSDGMSLLVASHATYSAASRATIAECDEVAGALLGEGAHNGACAVTCAGPESEVLVQKSVLDGVMRRIDQAEVDGEAEIAGEDVSLLPAPIRKAIARSGEGIEWKFRLPGIHEHVLTGYEGEEVSLLRARPGRRIFSHTHHGEEATLVLSGALEDGGRIYRAGDVSLADESDDHHPQIVGDETCVCLIVMSGGMHFTGTFGRALNLLSRTG